MGFIEDNLNVKALKDWEWYTLVLNSEGLSTSVLDKHLHKSEIATALQEIAVSSESENNVSTANIKLFDAINTMSTSLLCCSLVNVLRVGNLYTVKLQGGSLFEGVSNSQTFEFSFFLSLNIFRKVYEAISSFDVEDIVSKINIENLTIMDLVNLTITKYKLELTLV
ncbi:hypothetical protein D3C71_1390830 [compost metagenome]